MRKLLTTMFVLGVALSMTAQTSLRGVVKSEDGTLSISGAKVTLVNQDISTTTNANGEFALIYLEPIQEEVLIEAPGYITQVQLVNIVKDKANELQDVQLKADVQKELADEVTLQLSEVDLNDDEGKGQSTSSGSNATNDVFNANTGYAWSAVRFRARGLEQTQEKTYINGLNFNSAERGNFNYSMIGGLNDASRNKDEVNSMEASDFTFGALGKSTNIMMDATRYAQGWKVGLSGTNRTYKGRLYATYASGLLDNGWAFVGSLALRYSPYINMKGIIGEGMDYHSLGYFFSAEKRLGDNHRLSIVTFGAPTERAQSSALTQEVVNLTGSANYNPYWGYQNGKMRNSRIVKAFDPTAIISYQWNISDKQTFKAALGYHYSFYSNSALTFYNAPDPRPDYYRNLPSFLWDGQIDKSGNFITKDGANRPFDGGSFWDPYADFVTVQDGKSYNGRWIGPSVDKDAYNELVSAWRSRDNNTTQINWDNIYTANYAYDFNNADNPLRSAKYMIERRHNDIRESMININYQNSEFDHLKITAGLEAKQSEGIHYKTIDDLLGGTQWYDVDPFAERDIKELATNIGLTQSDIENVKRNDITITDESKRVVRKGDKFGYDYSINMYNAAVWAQNQWNFSNVDFFYALKVTYSSMQRTTRMVNGRAWYLAQLKPAEALYYLGPQYQQILNGNFSNSYSGYSYHFIDPSFKLGATYKINGRNRLKVNALAETSAPLARDAYISARVHDRVLNNIYTHANAKNLSDYYAASQKTVGYDLTYEFNYPIVRGRITAFQQHFWNGSELNGYYDDEARTFVNQALSGINRVHRGIEAAAAFKLGTYFTLTPMISISDYHYTSNAYSVTSAENGMALAESANGPIYELRDSVLIKGLKVANGPQLNTSLKLSFFHPKMWFADLTISYFDWNYLDYAPSRRMQGLFTGKRADGSSVNGSLVSAETNAIEKDESGNVVTNKYGIPQVKYPYNILTDQEMLTSANVWNRFIIDASVGKLIYLKNRQSLSINLSVSNLTNNTKFKTGGYQQARLPRATKQGKPDKNANSVISPNVWKFPAKYYYAWGVNFFLNVTYKF